MAMAILMADASRPDPVLDAHVAERLAALGVTRIALLSDPVGTGVVLEGWAFDPADIEAAVRVVFPDGAKGVRTLREVGLVALARRSEGRP